MNNTETAVQKFLESLSFRCEKIPAGSVYEKKTADFRASSPDGASYVIEVKGKEDSKEFAAALAMKGAASTIAPVAYSKTLHGKLRDAERQLATVSSPNDIRIMWMIHLAADAETQHDRLLYTLYGMQLLLDDNSAHMCHFFERPAFKYQNDIDAVVSLFRHRDLGEINALLLNPFSPRLSTLRESQLGLWFKTNAGVWDADALRSDPGFLFHDGDFVSVEMSLQAVRRKYNRPNLICATTAGVVTMIGS